MPAPSVRAIDATSANTQVKRARFVFTCDSVRRSLHFRTGSWAVFPLGKIPGFASPPHGGFALDGLRAKDVRPHLARYVGPGTGPMGRKY
jgi:hypothetical protein